MRQRSRKGNDLASKIGRFRVVAVACPTCNAGVREPCVGVLNSRGRPSSGSHQYRLALAADRFRIPVV